MRVIRSTHIYTENKKICKTNLFLAITRLVKTLGRVLLQEERTLKCLWGINDAIFVPIEEGYMSL